MNKKLFLFGVAAILMSACSDNEPFDNDNSPIAFDTYVGKQTRASQTTIDNLTEFGVHAYVNTNPSIELMRNERISKSGTGWAYSNIKYWPENNQVDFFAYAPYKADWTLADNKSFTYTVPAATTAQEDLIAATSFLKDKSSNSGKVGLIFKHLLSRIGFNAKSDKDYDPAVVTVTGLEVLYKADAIDNASTFTFATTGDSGGTVEAGSWAENASSQLPAGTSGELITDNVVMTTTGQSLNTPASAPATYLMMLPQEVAASDIQAKITYTVTYTNPAAVVTNEKIIDLPAVNWVMGKAYTYNFSISMSEIVFDGITVDNWVDGTQPTPTPVP